MTRYKDTPTHEIEEGIAQLRITDPKALNDARLELSRRKEAAEAEERAADRNLATKRHCQILFWTAVSAGAALVAAITGAIVLIQGGSGTAP